MSRYGKPFAKGDPVVFIDRKEREYYTILERGKTTDIRGDFLRHDEIIGRVEGFTLTSQRSMRYLVFRPTLEQHVRLMPRGAQVIYPKDIGLILIYADIYPGARVVECGLGSGALTSALLRAVGPWGRVISYEIRADFIRNAKKNLQNILGAKKYHEIREIDIYERFEERDVDRLILDVPEPWRAVETAFPHLRPGAIVCAYIPTVLQLSQYAETLRRLRGFGAIQSFETLLRPWKVDSVSVRPKLRMVAHTAFLTVARRMEDANPSASQERTEEEK